MVNEKHENPKTKLLEMLRNTAGELSGETMSRELNISRTAVWKHIAELKEKGYPLSASSRGYSLTEKTDFLYPWEFPGETGRVIYQPEVTSTMDLAKSIQLSAKTKGKLIILAEKQNKGRGRRNRAWVSKPGGLYMTLSLYPDLPMAYGNRVTMQAAAALVKMLREQYRVSASIKWPNDILVEGDKIAGILTEMAGEPDRIQHLNVGIGINIQNRIPKSLERACTLRTLTGAKINRKEFLLAFMNTFNEFSWQPQSGLVTAWKKYSNTIGKTVTIRSPFRDVTGKAIDINEDGSLVLKTRNNTVTTIHNGDLCHE